VLKNAGSKYYTTTKVSYGWNGNLYDPDPTDTPANNYSLERAEALGILEEGDED
jgi:hypothetical protein